MLRAVAPMAIEAAEEAERMLRDEDQDRLRIAELTLHKLSTMHRLLNVAVLPCDPDNHLIAAQLEKCREQLDRMQMPHADEARPTSWDRSMISRWHGRRRAPRCARLSDWCGR